MDRDIANKIAKLMYIADKLNEIKSKGFKLTDLMIAVVEIRADIKYGDLKRYYYY